jgi:hypothetical protein
MKAYNGRGDARNRIKEGKGALHPEKEKTTYSP